MSKTPSTSSSTSRKRKQEVGVTCHKTIDFNDDEDPDMYDVELVVGGVSFFVMKAILARHSRTFKSMFFGNFKERDQKVITLKDVDPNDFHIFLECIHGVCIQEGNVEVLARLGDMWNAPIVLSNVEDFLTRLPSQEMREYFQFSIKYQMQKLTNEIIRTIETKEDLLSIVHGRIEAKTFDPRIMHLLFCKSMQLLTGKDPSEENPQAAAPVPSQRANDLVLADHLQLVPQPGTIRPNYFVTRAFSALTQKYRAEHRPRTFEPIRTNSMS